MRHAILAAALFCAWAVLGRAGEGESELGIWLTVDGKEIRLTEQLSARPASAGGLMVFGAMPGLRTALLMRLPQSRLGTFRLAVTPGVGLLFGDMFSSDYDGMLQAAEHVPGSDLGVTITGIGKRGELLEGEFSATVGTVLPRRTSVITKGRLRVRILPGL